MAGKISESVKMPKELKTRLILIITIVVLAVLFVTSVVLYLSAISKQPVVVSKVARLGLKDIGELSTQAGYFTSVQQISDSRDIFGIAVPFTQNNYIFSYDGVIKAGVDFSDVAISISEDEKTIVIGVPEVKILSVEVDEDSLIVYNQTDNIFTPLKVEKMNESIAQMKETLKTKAIENGMLVNARTNADTVIRSFVASVYDLNEWELTIVDISDMQLYTSQGDE